MSEGGVPEESFGKAFPCLRAAVRWALIAHSPEHHLPPSHSEGWITLGEAPLWILWPSFVCANPLSTLRRLRGMDARSQAHFQADGEGPLLRRGPRSVCLLHSDQLRGPASCASLSEPGCRARGPRGRSAVPRPLWHLAQLPPRRSSPAPSDPRFLIPRLPPSSSRPLLGPASPGPERHAGVVDTWSTSFGLPGAPGRSPEPPSCCSS